MVRHCHEEPQEVYLPPTVYHLPPGYLGKTWRVCQDISHPQTPSLFSMVQGTPGPTFWKDQFLPSLPLALPFSGPCQS